MNLETWFASGEHIQLSLPPVGKNNLARSFNLFYHISGSGRWLTLLHGFPTCSWDYARVASLIEPGFRVLAFDFLGFGDSDKPHNHKYSLFEQADLTEAIWQQLGVRSTSLVAHDYGSTVALELMTRQAENKLSTHLERIILMNAGLYVDVQHPLLVQKLLQKPLLGAGLSKLIGEKAFKQQFSSLFTDQHPVSTNDLHQHWTAIWRREGLRNYHRLIYYLTERQQNKHRWETTLEQAELPVKFLWGMEDRVSGREMAERILARNPSANLHQLNGVGHYPHLDVPELVANEILLQDFD